MLVKVYLKNKLFGVFLENDKKMCPKQVQNKLLVLSMSRNFRKQSQKCTQITSDGPTPILDMSILAVSTIHNTCRYQ